MVQERPHYEELLVIEQVLAGGKPTDEEKAELRRRLDAINLHAIRAGVPVGEEADYFNFLKPSSCCAGRSVPGDATR